MTIPSFTLDRWEKQRDNFYHSSRSPLLSREQQLEFLDGSLLAASKVRKACCQIAEMEKAIDGDDIRTFEDYLVIEG